MSGWPFPGVREHLEVSSRVSLIMGSYVGGRLEGAGTVNGVNDEWDLVNPYTLYYGLPQCLVVEQLLAPAALSTSCQNIKGMKLVSFCQRAGNAINKLDRSNHSVYMIHLWKGQTA